MAFYESVFIARQDVSSAQVEGLTENFQKIITDQGGTVAKTESWGLRSLAYRIKKNRKGYYVLLNLDAPAAAIQEMERQMQLNEDVLRYLTIRVDELEEGPSAVMRAKERGDERGRRGGRDDRRPRDRDRDRDRGPERDGNDKSDAAKDDKKDAQKDDKKEKADAKDEKKVEAKEEKKVEAKDDKKAKAEDGAKDEPKDAKGDEKADDGADKDKGGDA